MRFQVIKKYLVFYLIIVIGMLNIFQTKKSNQQKFVTEEHFHSNLNKQKESNHQTDRKASCRERVSSPV